jgi:hypothetical protein
MAPQKISNVKLGQLRYYEDRHYIGTEAYHILSPLCRVVNLLVTDGIKAMCEKLECFWIIDEVGVEVDGLDDLFYVVYFIPNAGGGCDIIMDDGNYNRKKEKEISFTDLKYNLKLYLQRYDPGDPWVLFMPSEY